ncbi:MAG: hypothetical protein IK114_07460 [Fibrobacter sp.]|nr:hypothetical protein [Fibrobacter sp.]
MKIFNCAIALSVLLTMLVACGDDSSSSSVSPEPAEESSSSVIPASSGDLQSSSSKDLKNSSSSEEKAKESSSSVKPSSSDAKSSSSEEVKQSSSSVVASSSSVTGQSSSSSYDRTIAFNGSLWRKGAYKTFVDSRDNREYYYIEIAGEDTAGKAATIKVMAENLNVGEFVRGRKDQEDDTKIERYCYDNDTTNCNKYGGLYQWAEMMQLPSRCNTESCADSIKPNHQGICPDGWRLLTYNDLYIVIHSNNNKYGVEGIRAGRFGGSDDSGYSLIGAGYLFDHSFKEVETGTYWHYPEENPNDYAKMSKASWQSNASKSNPVSNMYKTQGFSVRCVMVE